jgi:DNA-directed RNA polymerase sigma subunit (sigma70/sigma32)
MRTGLAPKGVKVALMRQVPTNIPSKANMLRDIHSRELRELILKRSNRKTSFQKQEKVSRNTTIVLKRLGLADGRIYTLTELGEEYKIGKDRVRMIIDRELKLLFADSIIGPELRAQFGIKE